MVEILEKFIATAVNSTWKVAFDRGVWTRKILLKRANLNMSEVEVKELKKEPKVDKMKKKEKKAVKICGMSKEQFRQIHPDGLPSRVNRGKGRYGKPSMFRD